MFYPFWARIVALSDTDTCDLWSLHNFLLYTTLGLSVVAVSASFVWRPQPHGGLQGAIWQKFCVEVRVWLFFLSLTCVSFLLNFCFPFVFSFFLSFLAFSSPSRSDSRQIETARSD